MAMKLLFFLFVFGLVSSAYGQTDEFCDRVISLRDGRSNYFIPINVRSESFSGKVVVESYRLFDYLTATRGFDAKTYKSFMLKFLDENKELEMKGVTIDENRLFLSGENIKKYSFRVVESYQPFEVIYAQGCEELLQYYFAPSLGDSSEKGKSDCKQRIKLNGQDLFMRPKFNLAEQNNVIAKLFEMDIPISLDDISGSLRIGSLTLH